MTNESYPTDDEMARRRAERAALLAELLARRAAGRAARSEELTLSDRIHRAGGIVKRSRDNIRKQRKQKRRRKR